MCKARISTILICTPRDAEKIGLYFVLSMCGDHKEMETLHRFKVMSRHTNYVLLSIIGNLLLCLKAQLKAERGHCFNIFSTISELLSTKNNNKKNLFTYVHTASALIWLLT